MVAIHFSLPSRRRMLAAAVMGCALTIGACGSSGSKPAQTGNAAADFLAYSKCMRSHGVPNFPDPSAGGGINIPQGSNLNPFSPAFKAAHGQCKKLLPGGGPPQGISEQQNEQMVRTSECMRAHGVSGFPDPTTTPPSNPHDYSVVEGIAGANGGLFLLVPNTIDVSSPAFQQAAKICGFN